jgi:hypothetical protein
MSMQSPTSIWWEGVIVDFQLGAALRDRWWQFDLGWGIDADSFWRRKNLVAQEMAMITVGIISAVSVMAGSSLTWLLNNITTTETAKRAEQAAIRHLVEGHYLSVMTALENFLRAEEYGREIHSELSAMNAAIDLFANAKVKERFTSATKLISDFQDKAEDFSPRPQSLFHAGESLGKEWKAILIEKENLANAMCDHMRELQSFVR